MLLIDTIQIKHKAKGHGSVCFFNSMQKFSRQSSGKQIKVKPEENIRKGQNSLEEKRKLNLPHSHWRVVVVFKPKRASTLSVQPHIQRRKCQRFAFAI